MSLSYVITPVEFIESICESKNFKLCDVRSPIEFQKGHLPESSNLPILDDDQRHQIGLTYKSSGAQAARDLGYSLVGPQKKEKVSEWERFFNASPPSKKFLYCWRGGLRSKIAQEWIYAHSNERPIRVEGGYKAIRNELIRQTQVLPAFLVLSGKTGSGKTELLRQIQDSQRIDLEGIALHRGSSFGHHLNGEQPKQSTFENKLFFELIKKPGPVLLEDESRLIGRSVLPDRIYDKKNKSSRVLVKETTESRSFRIFEEYILLPQKTGIPVNALFDGFSKSLQSIRKKLGGLRFKEIKFELEKAFFKKEISSFSEHEAWISKLLLYYYDPAYSHALEKKKDTIIFSGSLEDCEAFILDYLKPFERT